MSEEKLPRGSKVILTNHAIEQYRERALEGIGSLENAEQLLRTSINSVRAYSAPPSWQRYYRDADAWIGTRRLSLPLMKTENNEWIAVSCFHYDHMKLSDEELIRTGVIKIPKGRL